MRFLTEPQDGLAGVVIAIVTLIILALPLIGVVLYTIGKDPK
jgi:hypothetical protein